MRDGRSSAAVLAGCAAIASGRLAGNLVAGSTYTLVCATGDEKGQPLTLYVATPLVPQR